VSPTGGLDALPKRKILLLLRKISIIQPSLLVLPARARKCGTGSNRINKCELTIILHNNPSSAK
jgi:hypothetical protein